jgi:hypothetical protein
MNLIGSEQIFWLASGGFRGGLQVTRNLQGVTNA